MSAVYYNSITIILLFPSLYRFISSVSLCLTVLLFFILLTPASSRALCCIARAERDGTRPETRFRLSPKRTSPFKSVGASVQSTAGSRGVRISLSNAG